MACESERKRRKTNFTELPALQGGAPEGIEADLPPTGAIVRSAKPEAMKTEGSEGLKNLSPATSVEDVDECVGRYNRKGIHCLLWALLINAKRSAEQQKAREAPY